MSITYKRHIKDLTKRELHQLQIGQMNRKLDQMAATANSMAEQANVIIGKLRNGVKIQWAVIAGLLVACGVLAFIRFA